MSQTNTKRLDPADAPILLAILIAARHTGDRLLATVARRELEERHKIKIRFASARDSTPAKYRLGSRRESPTQPG